jgi:hypothetical protein
MHRHRPPATTTRLLSVKHSFGIGKRMVGFLVSSNRLCSILLSFFLTNRSCCFTEVKQLKSLVRNIIDPSRDLGHVDRALKASKTTASADTPKGNGDALKTDLETDQRGKDQGKVDTNQESQKDACQDCQ